MEKRKYPLFIIDNSRSHGRGRETDYVSCTSNELPFVAEITLHKEAEYSEQYNPQDYKCIWSESRNGIRLRIRIITEVSEDNATLSRNLLRRCLKEVLLRHETRKVKIDEISNEQLVQWAQIFIDGIADEIRHNPNDKQARMNLAMFNKIIQLTNG